MRAAVLGVVLLALPAEATWRSSQIAGTPRDIDTLDAGMAVVASTSAMAIFEGSSGGISQKLSVAGNFASATWRSPDCLVGLYPSSLIELSGTCAAGPYLLPGGAQAGRLRRSPSGSVYAYFWTLTSALRVQRVAPGGGASSSDWIPVAAFSTRKRDEAPLSVLALPAGGEYAAWASEGAENTLSVFADAGFGFADGGLIREFPGLVRDIALFELNGTAGALAVMDGGQVHWNSNLPLPSSGFVPLGLPVRPYGTISFTANGGSAYGRGFGMLTAGNQTYSPVPNPAEVGQRWVLRTEDAGFQAGLVRATCHDPSFCAAITSSVGAPNVFAYFNDSQPSSDLRPAEVAYAGSAPYQLDAGDPDGDPIWVTWVDGGVYWDGGDPRSVTVFGPALSCVQQGAQPLVAILSDGLAAHDRQITIPVTATGSWFRPPDLLATPSSITLTAGGPAGAVGVSAEPGCTVPPLAWSIAPDGGLFTLIPNANGVSVEPPPISCQSSRTLFLKGTGAADASVQVPVTLKGWGRPNAPDFGAGLTQLAGTDASYAPLAPGHDCEGQPGGFPGTQLGAVRGLDAGVPGVTVAGSPTGLSVFSTNACASGMVWAEASREVLNTLPDGGIDPLQVSTPGALLVTIIPDWSPITASTVFDAGFSYDPGQSALIGDFSTDANCQADRGLRAEVVVSNSIGAPAGSKTGLAVPGPWRVPVLGGCAGGSFTAIASMIDDAGVRYGPVASYDFSTDRIDARVPALKQTTVPVSCGAGARGELELELLPTDCAVQRFTWTQEQGPLLVPRAEGSMVSFASGTGDLMSLAGQQLTWRITASVGPGNTAEATRSIRLEPAAFVQLAHRTDVPIPREEEALGVEVSLTNPTDCAVSGLVLRESLGGLKPIPGSVRLAGTPLDATIAGDLLEVPQLALPARGTIKVTYLARAPLLSGSRRPSARVLLTGTDVTAEPIAAVKGSRTGCGCDSSSEGVFALLALGVAAVRSRRRSV